MRRSVEAAAKPAVVAPPRAATAPPKCRKCPPESAANVPSGISRAETEIEGLDGLIRAKRSVHLPVVLTPVLPCGLVEPLRLQLASVKEQHERDMLSGRGSVELPDAIDRKWPRAAWEWPWQWVFPATRFYRVAEPPGGVRGQRRRHHLHESVLQRAVREAALSSGVPKRVSCHTKRHSLATAILEAGSDIRTIQELLGHGDVVTTMICCHVMNRGPLGVRSPADRLGL